MTCPDCARLLEEVKRLTQGNAEIRLRLAAYENPHTPPSQRAYPTRIHTNSSARRYLGRPRGPPREDEADPEARRREDSGAQGKVRGLRGARDSLEAP
jgi:hypothetical protein